MRDLYILDIYHLTKELVFTMWRKYNKFNPSSIFICDLGYCCVYSLLNGMVMDDRRSLYYLPGDQSPIKVL